MATVQDVRLDDGRVLRVHDTAEGGATTAFTVVWHHGSPQTGALLAPVVEAAAARGIRLLSYGRPGYGGSSPKPGRDVASAASDVAAVTNAFGIDRFAVMGASGGGPHALACAALLPERVSGVACFATLAPFGSDGLDWYAGMHRGGPSLRASEQGRAARALFEETNEFDPTSFTDRDFAALDGTWASLGADANAASAAGSDGLIDDDVAYVTPWHCDPARIAAPVLFAHGGEDRVVPASHSQWLLHRCHDAELWLRPRDSHISILGTLPLAMDWLRART
jgi:pimeloyl-ACP methyl ester carboxylesterase